MRQFLKRVLSSPIFIVSFAFALRMVLLYIGWQFGKNPVRDNLPYGYELGQVARSIAAGRGFASPLRFDETGPTIWFTPIYPYLIAGIFKLWGIYTDMSRIIIQVLNCAFSALTIIPIYGIGKRTFGDGVATGAAWTWVFLPTALYFPILWIWDTALIALLFALIFWATLAMREQRGLLSWAGYGALWVVGVLVNPSILSLFPFLLGWLMWEARKQPAPWAKPAATALLVFAIGLVPWTIRNYRVFGKFIVLRSNFGLELRLGNNPQVGADTFSRWVHPNDNPAEAERYKRMGEIAYMEQCEHDAFQFMRTHPLDTALVMFRRFVNTWLGVSDSPKDTWNATPLYGKAFLFLNAVIALASLTGVLLAHRNHLPDAAPYGFVLLIFPLVFYLTHSSLRYRFPIDPILITLGAGAIRHAMWLVRCRIGGKNRPITAAPLPAGLEG